jgi:Zn-dependent protease
MDMLISLPGIIIGLSFHEFAHGAMSHVLGDPTPRMQGRLTINPAAHIDPVGFLCLMFAGFGWGVPVQIDPRYYKHRRRDEFLVSIAGVTMNLLLAVLFSLLIRVLFTANPVWLNGETGSILIEMLIQVVLINLVLMIFNLIPVPPLDGSRLVTLFLPDKYYYKLLQYERYFVWAILAVAFVAGRISFIPSLTEIAYSAVVFIETLFINLFN